jgi:hypothetical protein
MAMTRRTRNRICIWVIFLGLLNFVAYTLVYAELGGDARNGYIGRSPEGDREYYVGGHFIRGSEGQFSPVPAWVWIYSYIHSISIWPTEAAVLVCLLILARPHIIATMREGGLMRGSTFIAVCSTIVILLASALTVWFAIRFVIELVEETHA